MTTINSTASVVPMVIDASERGERAYDIYSLLLKERIVFLGAGVNEQLANLIVAQLLYLDSQSHTLPINLYINSPGGVIYAGMAIYDAMRMVKAPVYTTAVGVTASMATVLLSSVLLTTKPSPQAVSQSGSIQCTRCISRSVLPLSTGTSFSSNA